MLEDDLKSDVYKAMCAAAWIMFFCGTHIFYEGK
jgi:hypothetical protein